MRFDGLETIWDKMRKVCFKRIERNWIKCLIGIFGQVRFRLKWLQIQGSGQNTGPTLRKIANELRLNSSETLIKSKYFVCVNPIESVVIYCFITETNVCTK